MDFLSHPDNIVLLIILLLLWVLLVTVAFASLNSSHPLPHLWGESYPLVIVDSVEYPICDNKLSKYCESWGYTYSTEFDRTPLNGYTLFIHEPPTTVNNEISMSTLMNISSNTNYVAFYDCDDYLISSNCTLTHDQIKSEVLSINLPTQCLLNLLLEGFPYLTDHGLIVHRLYIDNVFRNQPLPFKIPTIMPSFIPQRSRSASKTSKIPKIIHQTFQTHLIPDYIATAAYAWIDKNPEYHYRYYDDCDQREFIRSHFDERVLKAYDSLIPGAYKADLWRYCAIYIEGGVYVDIKMGPLMPLHRIIDPDSDLVVVNDTHEGTIYNAFFAAVPKHPAILKTIETVVSRVLNKEYGHHILYPTGPLAMGHSILQLYGYSGHAPNGKDKINSLLSPEMKNFECIQVYSHVMRDSWTTIVDIDGTELIKTRHSRPHGEEAYLHKITGLPHYRILWNQRAIYRDK